VQRPKHPLGSVEVTGRREQQPDLAPQIEHLRVLVAERSPLQIDCYSRVPRSCAVALLD
jgi:hypothetical protein